MFVEPQLKYTGLNSKRSGASSSRQSIFRANTVFAYPIGKNSKKDYNKTESSLAAARGAGVEIGNNC